MDGSVKFNSGTFNCGDKEYHKRDYYTDVDDPGIAKTAGKIEEQLLTDFFKAWTDVGRPVGDWKFRPFLQRETRGGSKIPRWRGTTPPGGGAPTYDFATFSNKLQEIEKIGTVGGRPLRSATGDNQ